MSTGWLILMFLMVFALILVMVSIAWGVLESQRKKRVTEMLSTAANGPATVVETTVLKEPPRENDMSFSQRVGNVSLIKNLQTQIDQAGLDMSAMMLLLVCAGAGVAGAFLGQMVRIPLFREMAAGALALVFGYIPLIYVRTCRRKRMAAFEQAFPEALDFMARSMRAGHAFSTSLEAMADESPDPLGAEFRQVFHEQNLGSPMQTTLTGLAARVPLLDVRFFVSAVLMQRETGGNLAEILTKLAFVIRERFRLKGAVKAATSHGRITAAVLSAMPIAVAAGLMVITPEYLRKMAEDPLGKKMILGSIFGQFLGYYTMKWITNIKV